MLHPGHLGDVAMPNFPDARCRGHADVFDRTIAASKGNRSAELANARAEALHLCHRCPALSACRQWYDALKPSQRPAGIVAGVLSSRRPQGYHPLASA